MLTADAATWEADRAGRGQRHGRLPPRPPAGAPQPAPGGRLPGGHRRAATDPGRLRFRRIQTEKGAFSITRGRHRPPDPDAARTRRHQGVVPAQRSRRWRRPSARSPWTCSASATPTSRSAPRTAPRSRRAAIAALLDALELERAHFVGHSMGGRVALELGFCTHERIRRTRADDAGDGLAARSAMGAVPAPDPPGAGTDPAGAASGRRAQFVRRMVPGADSPWAASGDRRVRARLRHRPRAGGVLCRRAAHLPGRAARRRRLLDPAAGAGARVAVHLGTARPADPDQLHASTSNERCRRRATSSSNCGHIPQIERPRETHTAIARFLDRKWPA